MQKRKSEIVKESITPKFLSPSFEIIAKLQNCHVINYNITSALCVAPLTLIEAGFLEVSMVRGQIAPP